MARTIKLTDRDATLAPFQIALNERVRSIHTTGREGSVRQGTFEGELPGSYDIIYEVDVGGGQHFLSQEDELEVLRGETWQPIFG